MLIVAPTGRTKRVTRLSTLLFSSRHLNVIGKVAELRGNEEAYVTVTTVSYILLYSFGHTLKMFPGPWWELVTAPRWRQRGSSWWRQSKAWVGQRWRGWAGHRSQWQCTCPADPPWPRCPPFPQSYQRSGTGYQREHTWGSNVIVLGCLYLQGFNMVSSKKINHTFSD